MISLIRYYSSKKQYANNSSKQNFRKFLINESHIVSPAYICKKVKIHNEKALLKCRDTGAIISFLHYGNFFLIGASLTKNFDLPYTAVASLDNVSGKEKDLWYNLHQKINRLYTCNMILRDSNKRRLVECLKNNFFIGMALDVHTIRKNRNLKQYNFQDSTICLDDFLAKICKTYRKPVVACCSHYDFIEDTHHMHFSEVISHNSEVTKQSLAFLEKKCCNDYQFFHNIKHLFKSNTGFDRLGN